MQLGGSVASAGAAGGGDGTGFAAVAHWVTHTGHLMVMVVVIVMMVLIVMMMVVKNSRTQLADDATAVNPCETSVKPRCLPACLSVIPSC